MRPGEEEWKTELRIGKFIRIILLVATGVTVAGGALYLHHFGNSVPHYTVFTPGPPSSRSPAAIILDAASLNFTGIIQLGILLLLSIPIIRVALFTWVFLGRRDWLYSAMSLLVLGILLFSILRN